MQVGILTSTVYFEDCIKALARYSSGHFALAIVDPPYAIGESMKRRGVGKVRQRSGNVILVQASNYAKQDWDRAQPPQEYFDQLFRVARKVIIWGENYLSFDQKSTSSGRIIWDKVNGDNDFSSCEIAWTNIHTSVRQVVYMWNGFMQGKSLEEPRVQQPDKRLNEVRIQAGQKPVLLYRKLLADYAKPGDLLLDTHLGSGSHRLAAWQMGIDLVAFENNAHNFAGQEKRFSRYINQLDLFAKTDYIYNSNVSVATRQFV